PLLVPEQALPRQAARLLGLKPADARARVDTGDGDCVDGLGPRATLRERSRVIHSDAATGRGKDAVLHGPAGDEVTMARAAAPDLRDERRVLGGNRPEARLVAID